jgi:hypothetical protein
MAFLVLDVLYISDVLHGRSSDSGGCHTIANPASGSPFLAASFAVWIATGFLCLHRLGQDDTGSGRKGWGPKFLKFWKRPGRAVLSSLGLLFAICAVEMTLGSIAVVDKDGTLIPQPKREWGFGQIIALVMVAGQILEIAGSYLSQHQQMVDKYCGPIKKKILWFIRSNSQASEDSVQLLALREDQGNQGEVVNATSLGGIEAGDPLGTAEITERRSIGDVIRVIPADTDATPVSGNTEFRSGYRHSTW